MTLATIDWILIGIYLLVSLAIALRYAGRAGQNLGEFFLGGRSLPWYVAGISMVATTFAADTPLAVTELVAQSGISGNWLWWNMLIGGMLTTFFFARLWRRANVLTEVEFISLRYGGAPARFLRGFKAVYLGLFMNVLVIGWVNVALISLLQEFFGLEYTTALWVTGGAMLIVAIYSSLGGLLGVAITDMVQFGIAMTGSIVLAVLVLNSDEVGGIDGLQAKLSERSGVFDFFPVLGDAGSTTKVLLITAGAFIARIGLQWWASWYPGAEPGGGGYVAQRMMSAKSEKDSILATLFFNIAHYCLRPWPWILVALATLVLYPELAAGDDAKLGYVRAMKEFLPDGWRGLMLVAFLAAYMSTISTQLNWGASYLINDLYKPTIRPETKFANRKIAERHYVLAGRIATLLLMAVALFSTTLMDSISGVWAFMVECGAGLGLVLILRWFWWRINVWSEIAATVAPFVIYGLLKALVPGAAEGEPPSLSDFPNSYFITVGGTTIIWLLVTFLTPPEESRVLDSFYKRVRPGGIWAPVRIAAGLKRRPSNTLPLLIGWLGAVAMTYSVLFALGKFFLADGADAWAWVGVALIGAFATWWGLRAMEKK